MNYLYGGIGILILLLGGYGVYEHIASLKSENVALHTSLDTATNDNKLQATAIKDLQVANKAWADAAKEQGAKYNDAVADLARATVARQAAELRLAKAEAADKALPACEALMAVDLAKTCPATEAAIRERAK